VKAIGAEITSHLSGFASHRSGAGIPARRHFRLFAARPHADALVRSDLSSDL